MDSINIILMDFQHAIEKVLGHEGGYVNDPDDPGGETNWGISKRAYPHINIETLTKDQAKDVYKKDYWDKCKCEFLPEKVKYIHFDTSVNMGISSANKILQEAIGVTADGQIGSQTLSRVSTITLDRYSIYRLKRYLYIISKNHTLAKYAKGWCNRVIDIVNTKEQNYGSD